MTTTQPLGVRLTVDAIILRRKGNEMTDKAWKAAERRVARILGGARRANNGESQEDVAAGRLSIQVKHGNFIPKIIVAAMEQARRDCPKGNIPVAAFHPKGTRTTYVTLTALDLAALSPDLVLCMDIREFAALAYEGNQEVTTDE